MSKYLHFLSPLYFVERKDHKVYLPNNSPSCISFQVESDGRLEHLSLYLSEGVLVISVNTGTETLNTRITPGLNNGREHLVAVTLQPGDITVVVDDGRCHMAPCQATLVTTRDPGILELNQPLYVGGIGPELTPYILSKLEVTENFVGCFQVSTPFL